VINFVKRANFNLERKNEGAMDDESRDDEGDEL